MARHRERRKTQCSGRNRNGTRCGWPCVEGQPVCKKHMCLRGKTLSPEHKAALHAGRAKHWLRLAQAMDDNPELRKIFYPKKSSEALKEHVKRARSFIGKKNEEKVGLVLDQSSGSVVLKASALLNRAKDALDKIPDKPFNELSPHEKMVANTGLSLDHINLVLRLPVKDKEGVLDLKLLKLVTDTACKAIASQTRVDGNMLVARKSSQLTQILDQLKAGTPTPGDAAKVIDG